MSVNVAKWTLFVSLCASIITSFLLLTFSNCHAGVLTSVFHSLSTAAFASRIFIACGMGINFWTYCNVTSKKVLCLQCGLHDSRKKSQFDFAYTFVMPFGDLLQRMAGATSLSNFSRSQDKRIVVAFLWFFVWLFINLTMREQTLSPGFAARFCFVKLTLVRMPIFTRRSRARTFQIISACWVRKWEGTIFTPKNVYDFTILCFLHIAGTHTAR